MTATGDLRTMMASFPTGVSIVTSLAPGGRPWGMTCSSLCSVSLEPPILLVCLRGGSPTLDAVLASGAFAVNLLHSSARNTAVLFASGSPERFDRVDWHADGTAGPHLVRAAHTVADCAVHATHEVGDHTVVMGLVRAVTPLRAADPLLYGLRQFAPWPEDTDNSHLSYDFIS